MSSPKRLDLVIFGASGYTGKHVVKELTRISRNYPDITWAVAGRNRIKLEKVLQDVSKKTGDDLSKIKILTACVEDKMSLKEMCGQAKVVINCCGPFVKYGEMVVATAVKCKTHYVDVSGETEFIELLEEKYDQLAREAGIYIINACGLSSIPADLGVLFLEQNFGGTLNSVESYFITHFPPRMMAESKANGIIRYSSWESIINSMAYISMKKIQQKPSFHLVPELKQSKISCTRRLLLKHPKLCSFGLVTYGDPKEGVMDDSCFQYEMLGQGWNEGTDLRKKPNKNMVARISVSGIDPAYVGTAVAIVFSAITILKEEDKMPSISGVMTPGIAFRKTSIIKHLQENEIKFEIIKNSK